MFRQALGLFTFRLNDVNITFSKTYGPFDGVLGFSQGAAMAGLLCSMQVFKFSD